jgi:hypothetical protein
MHASDVELFGWPELKPITVGNCAMTVWAIRSSSGCILPEFVGASHQEVSRKVLQTRYDPFRLQVSASYREVFDRAVRHALQREGWEIVRVNRRMVQNEVDERAV